MPRYVRRHPSRSTAPRSDAAAARRGEARPRKARCANKGTQYNGPKPGSRYELTSKFGGAGSNKVAIFSIPQVERASIEKVTIVGLDLAKRSFQAHGALADGTAAFRKKLSREKVLAFLAEQPRCSIAMEACGSAHHWGRAIGDLGHEVRLIPPTYVKAFVKRQKNDAADAEAICEAATRPTMRFVPVKSQEQQARGMLFRTRDLLVRQRTQFINALRGHLAEHGVVAPQGPAAVKVLTEAVEEETTSLPLLVIELSRIFLEQIGVLSEKIIELAKVTMHEATHGAITRRLQTVPGVGPITVVAIETFAPSMPVFKRGRIYLQRTFCT